MTSTDTTLDRPADTRVMGVVHSALRRDLFRVRLVLGSGPVPDVRRRAVAEHLVWLMDFLHEHHEGEDTGLFPLVRERDAELAALLDEMDAEHQAIHPAMAGVEAAARAWAADPTSDLLGPLVELETVLLPHLRHEELELMPRVAAVMTHREWMHWDHTTFVRTKTARELAFAGHWMVDSTTPEDHRAITSMVGPVPRFVLLHLLGGPYRRRRALLWGGTPAAAVPSLPL